MHKGPLIAAFLTAFFAVALFASQAKPETGTPAMTSAPPVVVQSDRSSVSAPADFEPGGELLATLRASNFVYCKNIGGACTSNSQCGNLGQCVNNICECECNYGAYCNPNNPQCGYAGFCNEFNHRCACY